MKGLKLIKHPVVLIVSFLIIIISGQHLGGFYILYILLGLFRGTVHSLMAVLGIALLIFNYRKYKIKHHQPTYYYLNIISVMMLVSSIVMFFYLDPEQYNFSTFHQLVPQITLTIFGVVATCFLLDNIISVIGFYKKLSLKHNNPKLE